MRSAPVQGGWRAVILLAAGPTAASPQVTADPVQDTARVLESCDGRTVSEIVVTPRDPSFLSFPRLLRPSPGR